MLVVKAVQITSGNAVITITATCNKDRDHLEFAGRHELSAERNCVIKLLLLDYKPPQPLGQKVRGLIFGIVLVDLLTPSTPQSLAPNSAISHFRVSPVALKLTAKVFCYQPSRPVVSRGQTQE